MQNNHHTYLIRLRPAGNFFFGGEVTFGGAGDVNYLVHSNPFPQQTALLGMLRRLVLQKQGIDLSAKRDQNAINQAILSIGETGFRKANHTENTYGWIDRISTLAVEWKGAVYLPRPWDSELIYQPVAGESVLTKPLNTAPDLVKYDAKTGIDTPLQSLDGGSDLAVVHAKGLLEPYAQIGIQKSEKNSERDKGFYKQTFYRMRKGGAFVFYARLGTDLFKDQESHFVQLGGEKSIFRADFHKTNQSDIWDEKGGFKAWQFENIPITGQKWILLSHAFLPPDIGKHADFILGATLPMRYLESSVSDTTRYSNLNRYGQNTHKHWIQRSNKFILLQAGSVLYFSNPADKAALLSKLMEPKEFIQIGYNHFQPG